MDLTCLGTPINIIKDWTDKHKSTPNVWVYRGQLDWPQKQMTQLLPKQLQASKCIGKEVATKYFPPEDLKLNLFSLGFPNYLQIGV